MSSKTITSCLDDLFSRASSRLRHFHREVHRGYHAVRPRNVFAGDVEGRSVIGACPREGKTESYVYAFVKGVQLQRNQSLVVIHAKHGVPGAICSVIKNGVGGKRTANDCRLSIGDGKPGRCFASVTGRLEFGDSGCDQFDLFAAERAGFTGVRVQTSDGDAWLCDS